MAKVTFIGNDGRQWEGEGADGTTLMELARAIGFDGIVAECGGVCACATCQVILDDTWLAVLGEPRAAEAEMLEMAEHGTPATRLACQIPLSAELDGLIVRVPQQQG